HCVPLHSFPTRRSSDLIRLLNGPPSGARFAAASGALRTNRKGSLAAAFCCASFNHPSMGDRTGGTQTGLGAYELREEASTLRIRSEEHTSELQSRENLV